MLNVMIEQQLWHFKVQVQFDIKNEIVVLFGPSGSGKTTILHCLAGLRKPDQGLIRLNGMTLFETGKVNVPVQKRQIGYLFQDYALFPHMTVWKNIAYGMKTESFTKQIMEELNISHLMNQYPHEISGGEKQRVALTRALATEPNALLLDEPFSALDNKTREKSHDELLRLHKLWNIPIIVVTHNIDEAQKLSDRILYINQGKLSHTDE